MEQELLTEIRDYLKQIKELEAERLVSSRPMDIEEAAAYLKVHPRTVRRWSVEEGRIAYSRLGDGERACLRFRREDLDDYIARYQVPTVEALRENVERRLN